MNFSSSTSSPPPTFSKSGEFRVQIKVSGLGRIARGIAVHLAPHVLHRPMTATPGTKCRVQAATPAHQAARPDTKLADRQA